MRVRLRPLSRGHRDVRMVGVQTRRLSLDKEGAAMKRPKKPKPVIQWAVVSRFGVFVHCGGVQLHRSRKIAAAYCILGDKPVKVRVEVV